MEQKRWSGKILVAHRQEPGVRPLPFPPPCQLARGEMGYGLVEPVGVRLQLVSFARKSPMPAPIFFFFLYAAPLVPAPNPLRPSSCSVRIRPLAP
jgi:hypothetical protein